MRAKNQERCRWGTDALLKRGEQHIQDLLREVLLQYGVEAELNLDRVGQRGKVVEDEPARVVLRTRSYVHDIGNVALRMGQWNWQQPRAYRDDRWPWSSFKCSSVDSLDGSPST